ncbi:hypothetical protein [uncultured Desulfosarcina sp.]|nr:hypothetical protein [uncultured Desulfosarcina sp.]
MMVTFPGINSVSGDSDSPGTIHAHRAMVGWAPARMSKQAVFDLERTISQ